MKISQLNVKMPSNETPNAISNLYGKLFYKILIYSCTYLQIQCLSIKNSKFEEKDLFICFDLPVFHIHVYLCVHLKRDSIS